MTCFFNAFGYLFAMVLEIVFHGFGHVFCFRYCCGQLWFMDMVLISFLGIVLGIFEIGFPLPEAFPILESTVL